MKVDFKRFDSTLIVTVIGRIDSCTAAVLADAMNANLKNSINVVFNFADVDYISSAGIRVMLQTRKHTKSKDGTVAVQNANDDVKSVFDITGVSKMFNL